MHVMFVHRAFPGRFGHLAQRLVDRHGARVTYVSARRPAASGAAAGVRHIGYRPVDEGESPQPLAARFDEQAAHAQGVLRAVRAAAGRDRSVRPDLIVGAGGGSVHLLAELWPEVPVVSLFDYFYAGRPAADVPIGERVRARMGNAATLLDLEASTAGWCPTSYQRNGFPQAYRERLAVIPEGVDTDFWHPVPRPQRVGDLGIAPEHLLVTYVQRPTEPEAHGLRDAVAILRRLVAEHDDVRVLAIVPPGRVRRSGDGAAAPTDDPRIRIRASLPPERMRQALSASHLHLHLAAANTLSWSVLDAMACGAPVLTTGAPPIRETVTDGEDAVVVPADEDAVVGRALELLDDGAVRAELGSRARETIQERHSLDVTVPQLVEVFRDALGDPSAFVLPPPGATGPGSAGRDGSA